MSETKKLSAAELPNLDHEGNPKGFFALSVEVLVELKQAMTKHPTWPTDPLHALAILGEEFGELTKAMLQLTYEPAKTSHQEVYAEAIQTAAMALRLAVSLHEYSYTQANQHKQDASALDVAGGRNG